MGEQEPQSKPQPMGGELLIEQGLDPFDFSHPLAQGIEEEVVLAAAKEHQTHYEEVLKCLDWEEEDKGSNPYYPTGGNKNRIKEWHEAVIASNAVRNARESGLSNEDIREEASTRLAAINSYLGILNM